MYYIYIICYIYSVYYMCYVVEMGNRRILLRILIEILNKLCLEYD